MDPGPPVSYHIDHNDSLDAFNEGWLAFADANGGESLHPSRIRGRQLWEFVREPTTAQLYRSMLVRLRSGGRPIRFRFRCDAPDRRRLLEMDMTADAAGGIQFNVTSVHEEARAPVLLLDPNRTPGNGFLTICAWCKRVRLSQDEWVEVEDAVKALNLFEGAPLPALTHGVCPACSETMLETAV